VLNTAIFRAVFTGGDYGIKLPSIYIFGDKKLHISSEKETGKVSVVMLKLQFIYEYVDL
jgi:hypothetical protein